MNTNTRSCAYWIVLAALCGVLALVAFVVGSVMWRFVELYWR